MNAPFRRHVFYLPGYDPIPPRRYRELYRREGADQAKISGYDLTKVSRRDKFGFGWAVMGQIEGRSAIAEFEVLIWSDLVQSSMGKGILATYGQLLRTSWAYIGSGALWRLMKLRRGPVLAALYPIMVLVLQLVLALCAGYLAGYVVSLGLGWMIGGLVMAGTVWAVLNGFRRLDGRIFAYYLMHDYAFTAQQGGAYPQVLDTRIQTFVDRIADVLTQDLDEVLIVGHSSGAYLAVSVLADLIRAGHIPQTGPKLSLLTLGHVVPMASFLPQAHRLRRDLHDLSASEALDWVDVSAPGDPCCFGLCDPVVVSGAEPPHPKGPLIVSAAFRQTLSPEKRRSLRGRWFRLHFQYLCAFDQPGFYDYFRITAGPITLGQRYAERGHSPTRIARPVNRYRA